MSNNVSAFIKKYRLKNIDNAMIIGNSLFNVSDVIKGVQNIAFDNAVYAFTLGVAAVLQNDTKDSTIIANILGEALQSVCISGSVADKRQVGIGHGKLASRLLDERTSCFCFLAGHESFAAANGAINVAISANKLRKKPLKVILNGLGKDAAYIISRINGFTYKQTSFDYDNNKLKIVKSYTFGKGEMKKVAVYGADSVEEGVAIMQYEKVDVSITGNSTNPVRFTHPVAGIYNKYCTDNGLQYFSVASGGGTGRTLHPDNVAAGPASYGLTDYMGRMHCDVQFAGSSSVPAHVNMMGFIGMGNNPLVGAMLKITSMCIEVI